MTGNHAALQGTSRSPRIHPALGYIALIIALPLVVAFGLVCGDVAVSLPVVVKVLGTGPRELSEYAFAQTVVWQIRLPRIIASLCAGAVLSGCGVVFQGVLRNELAEPYTLGVASGGAFGASVAILLGLPWVSAAAFLGCIGALFFTLLIGQRRQDRDPTRIILAGVIVGSILSAGLTLIKAIAGEKVALIVIWLLGSFSAATWLDVVPMMLSLCFILIISLSCSKELDIIASGAVAEAIGVSTNRVRVTALLLASLAISLVVSRFGVIGFVGLAVPHLLRLIFGPAHMRLLPLSLLAGGILLCGADTLAKQMNELPVGVLTVLIGGPTFCALLWSRQ